MDAKVDPRDLLHAASGIPDPLLSELALDERSARSAALVACGQRDATETDAALTTVDVIDAVMARRLGELGL